jgi:HAD superfamily hydrolase (TIGR01509 family)
MAKKPGTQGDRRTAHFDGHGAPWKITARSNAADEIRGFFVDLDGTLADSVTALRSLYFSFLAEFGATGSEEEFQLLNGPPLRRVVEVLKELHQLPGEPSQLLDRYMARLQAAHESALPAAGASVVLSQARHRGWRTGVVTSSPREAALAWLRRTALMEMIDVVVGGDDVASGKPAPEPYLRAIALCNCTATRSIAVEDSVIGAASATAAGLQTFVIARMADRPDWPPGARFVDRFADLTREL